MKNIFLTFAFTLCIILVHAQTFQIRDLENAVGFWEGKLTYLDYTSGKPFSIPANITIRLTEDKKGFITSYEYPKEPHANSRDTAYVAGKFFGKERIVDFKQESGGGFIFITETDGEDGNDHKKAVLRHTYQQQSNTFSIKKEVKFEGSESWIKRNEYLFHKVVR